jgi:hypothetical protein
MRKPIVEGIGAAPEEKCGSTAHLSCLLFQEREGTVAPTPRCPFLEEKLVQYCSAAAAPKYIPYNEPALTRCGDDTFRYCETYRAMAHPQRAGLGGRGAEIVIDGITVPERLYFAPNHMWLDSGESGVCHVGIDDLLVQVTGRVERISFTSERGVQRPTAVLTAQGVDWPMVFPRPMLIEHSNTYLRANIARAEGRELLAHEPGTLMAGMIRGKEALGWMQEEIRRLNEFLHRLFARRQPAGAEVLNDGGGFVPGVAQYLQRDEVLQLFNAFFAPHSEWVKTP